MFFINQMINLLPEFYCWKSIMSHPLTPQKNPHWSNPSNKRKKKIKWFEFGNDHFLPSRRMKKYFFSLKEFFQIFRHFEMLHGLKFKMSVGKRKKNNLDFLKRGMGIKKSHVLDLGTFPWWNDDGNSRACAFREGIPSYYWHANPHLSACT